MYWPKGVSLIGEGTTRGIRVSTADNRFQWLSMSDNGIKRGQSPRDIEGRVLARSNRPFGR
jgi:hypothetical protein